MLEVAARAKINWTLTIVGTRPDGYHLMDMLMASVDLQDTLLLEEAEELTLWVTEEIPPGEALGKEASAPVPVDGKNLVLKAAKALQRATGCERGAAMRLHKRIPVGAGMGGGSADAAAALVGLCSLWGLALPEEKLMEIGLSLGADVPFALTGGLARVRGIGEEITVLPASAPIWLVVTQPCAGLSTPEIFQGFDRLTDKEMAWPQTEEAQKALLAGDLPALGRAMGNVMERVSIAKRPEIRQAALKLEALGAIRAMMTGSGSAVYGVFESEEKARQAAKRLGGLRTYVTHTTGEGITLRERPSIKMPMAGRL